MQEPDSRQEASVGRVVRHQSKTRIFAVIGVIALTSLLEEESRGNFVAEGEIDQRRRALPRLQASSLIS